MLGLGIGRRLGVPVALDKFRQLRSSSVDWYHFEKTRRHFPFLGKPIAEDPVIDLEYQYYVKHISREDMAISRELAQFLNFYCMRKNPKRILDLGSGFSSFVLRRYASRNSDVQIVSVDDDAQWLQKTKSFLQSRHLPDEQCIQWCELLESKDIGKFDFVFYDLGDLKQRTACFQNALSFLSNDGDMLLDDFHKLDYQRTVLRWCSKASLHLYSVKKLTLDNFNRWSVLVQCPKIH